jgi:CHAT domain-containing protein
MQPKIIAFATHGLSPNDLPGLFEPALALSVDPNRPGKSLLKASEIAKLNLNADWVVLSACNTADQNTGEKEIIHSLSNAFLFSGVRSLLVTQWPVESTATRDLMIDTFEAFKKSPSKEKSTSLQSAMLKMMKTPNRSHPFYWAPFSLISD